MLHNVLSKALSDIKKDIIDETLKNVFLLLYSIYSNKFIKIYIYDNIRANTVKTLTFGGYFYLVVKTKINKI